MTKPVRLIIIFTVITALILSFFLITARMKKKAELEREAGTTEVIRITDIAEGKVRTITLENPKGRFVFTREGDSWRIEPAPPFDVIYTNIDSMERVIRSMTAVRVVEESPESLGPYGLSPSLGTVTADLEDGTQVVLNIGSMTPERSAYYVQKKGDPRVYIIRSYAAAPFLASLNDFRQMRLTHIDKETLQYLRIVSDRTMEFVPRDKEKDALIAPFSQFTMTKPWMNRRGTDTEKFSAFLESIPFAFTVSEFIDDDPEDLGVYGLENPEKEFVLRDAERELHVLLGNAQEGYVFARESQGGPVFTLPSRDLAFMNRKPFDLTDKFALIINIDFVDRILFTAGAETYTAEIKRKPGDENDEETEYYFNDRQVEEKPFKEFYQKIIGLLYDAENPEPQKAEQDGRLGTYGYPEVSIEYFLNIQPEPAVLTLYPYNRDFYAAARDGFSEFLLSRNQIETAIDTARDLDTE